MAVAALRVDAVREQVVYPVGDGPPRTAFSVMSVVNVMSQRLPGLPEGTLRCS